MQIISLVVAVLSACNLILNFGSRANQARRLVFQLPLVAGVVVCAAGETKLKTCSVRSGSSELLAQTPATGGYN